MAPIYTYRDYLSMMKRQKTPWSCGAAAVRNALRVYGIKVSEEEVRSVAGTTKTFGTCEKGIMRALREWGLKAVEHHFDSKAEAWEWIHSTLQDGRAVILAVEDWEHWVLAVGSLGGIGVVVYDSQNTMKNVHESNVHVWNKKVLMSEWWNSRRHPDVDGQSRLYAISVSK